MDNGSLVLGTSIERCFARLQDPLVDPSCSMADGSDVICVYLVFAEGFARYARLSVNLLPLIS